MATYSIQIDISVIGLGPCQGHDTHGPVPVRLLKQQFWMEEAACDRMSNGLGNRILHFASPV